MGKSGINIQYELPTEEEINRAYYAIIRAKANNEDTFINDGGERSYQSRNDKKGGSFAFWKTAFDNDTYDN